MPANITIAISRIFTSLTAAITIATGIFVNACLTVFRRYLGTCAAGKVSGTSCCSGINYTANATRAISSTICCNTICCFSRVTASFACAVGGANRAGGRSFSYRSGISCPSVGSSPCRSGGVGGGSGCWYAANSTTSRVFSLLSAIGCCYYRARLTI